MENFTQMRFIDFWEDLGKTEKVFPKVPSFWESFWERVRDRYPPITHNSDENLKPPSEAEPPPRLRTCLQKNKKHKYNSEFIIFIFMHRCKLIWRTNIFLEELYRLAEQLKHHYHCGNCICILRMD